MPKKRPTSKRTRAWNLVHGLNHGFGQWIPYCIQRQIVGVWNRVACLFIGHDFTKIDIMNWKDSGWPKDRIPCCIQCCAKLKVKDPNAH